MAPIGDALRQAFVPKYQPPQPQPQQHEVFAEEDRVWSRLKRPLILSISILLFLSVIVPAVLSLRMVFPAEPSRRPFCRARRRLEEALPVNSTGQLELYRYHGGSMYVTEEEAADFYWLVVFLPTAIVFSASALYLVAGMCVAYTAPRRHFLLKVVENGFCASRRAASMMLVHAVCHALHKVRA